MVERSPASARRPRGARRWVLGTAGGALVCLSALGVAAWRAPSLVETRIEAAAAARLGFPVDLEGVTVGLTSLHIDAVEGGGPGLEVAASKVRVSWSWGWSGAPTISAPAVTVGHAAVTATRMGVETWLARRASRAADRATATDDGGAGLTERLDLDGLSWTLGPAQLSLDPEGARGLTGLRAMLVAEGAAGAGTLTLREVVVERGPRSAATAERVDLSVQRDGDGGLVFPMTAHVSGGALELTREIFAVEIDGTLTVEEPSLQRVAFELRGGLAPRQAEGEQPAGDSARAPAGAPAGTPAGTPAGEVSDASPDLWTLRGAGRRDLSEGHVRIEMSRFELGRAPRLLARLPLVESEQAIVGGDLELTAQGARIGVQGSFEVQGLHVQHPLLAPAAVDEVGFSASLQGSAARGLEDVTIDQLLLRRDEVELSVQGGLRWSPDPAQRAVKMSIELPRTPCQTVLASVPEQLVPGLRRLALGGEMKARVDVDVDMRDLSSLRLDADIDTARCRVTRAPGPAGRVQGEFVHKVLMKDGRVRSLDLSPGSRDFTPLAFIAPSMVGAVLTTEDAGFFRHEGFLGSQLEGALRRNLEEGRVRLGASTISMQLAKNLLLSHERTLSRKLQEFVLTWLLEKTLTKERMMELYLNIVEFGPAIYGITAAAEHYFGKSPQELTSLESAWLALMLPNPVERYGHFCQGAPSAVFEVKLRRVHRLMHGRGHIDEIEYTLWKEAPLVFAETFRLDEAACMARRATMKAGPKTQRALSGVLGRPRTPPGEEAPDLAPGRRPGGEASAPLAAPEGGELGQPRRIPSSDAPRIPVPPVQEPRPAMDVEWDRAR